MFPWKYQHLTNMATDGIYINNYCDIPHFPHLFDSLSTDNFGRNLTTGIASLFLVTHFLSCDIVCKHNFKSIFKKSFHIFTIKSCRSSDTASVRFPQTQRLVTFPQSLSHILPVHSFLIQLSGITTPFSLPYRSVSLTEAFFGGNNVIFQPFRNNHQIQIPMWE